MYILNLVSTEMLIDETTAVLVAENRQYAKISSPHKPSHGLPKNSRHKPLMHCQF